MKKVLIFPILTVISLGVMVFGVSQLGHKTAELEALIITSIGLYTSIVFSIIALVTFVKWRRSKYRNVLDEK